MIVLINLFYEFEANNILAIPISLNSLLKYVIVSLVSSL